MNLPTEIDVLIAGGGIAGVAVAAALREFGCRVCIVEPGLDDSKRLAGELIHPPGAAALAELGLLSALENVGGVSVSGFAVSLSPDAPVCMLPYAEIPGCVAQGLALEHGLLRKHLLAAIATCPNVTVCHGARITAIDVRDPQAAVATIENGGSSVRLLRW